MARALKRCFWAGDDPLMVAYHDEEWGVPIHDDRRWYEKLTLDGAQAGLSWMTILRKREGYREAFRGFDAAAVARFGERDVERLMKQPGIVRNRLKIKSAIGNARAMLALAAEHGSFDAGSGSSSAASRSRAGGAGAATCPRGRRCRTRCPPSCAAAASPSSARRSSTRSCRPPGLVNDHTLGCFRRTQVAALGRRAAGA